MNALMSKKQLLQTLRATAEQTLDTCALTMGTENGLIRSYKLHVPSGDMKYKNFWVRDSAMMAESSLIGAAELADWLDLICRYGQNGPEERKLLHGLYVPPWSIPDHIRYDGGAVFYPGTNGAAEDQGIGRYGITPPGDDAYYFIGMQYQLFMQDRIMADRVLHTPINNLTPLERAEKAFMSARIDAPTGLCVTDDESRSVDWGFCDTIMKTGLLLFPSLLRFRAAHQLAVLLGERPDAVLEYRRLADQIAVSVAETFADGDGWLLSATGKCCQPDVWGTAFAIYVGALSGEILDRAAAMLSKSYGQGMISSDGYVRHIPQNRDFDIGTAWEGAMLHNEYQNGGFWATPTGWVAYALAAKDEDDALRILTELVTHTRRTENGTPWEWKNADDSKFSGKKYATSAALPYTAAVRLWA